MRVALIFNMLRPDTTGIYIERALQGLGVETRHWPLGAMGDIPGGYDLYLRVDHGDDYDIPPPARLRPVVFYVIDTHLPHNWKKIRRAARAYDRLFCAQRRGAERLPNASWLPVGCDPELHGAASREEVWDLAFVGTDGGVPRKFYLQALRERYPNSRIGTAAHTEMGSIYGRARIGFNYSIRDDVNMRVFEVLAAKTPLLTNALPGDDYERLGLQDGRHLLLYRSPAELFERVDALLSDPARRRSLAEAGAAVVAARHTYRHRVSELLMTLGFSIPAPR